MEEGKSRGTEFWGGFLWGLAAVLAIGAALTFLLRYTDVGKVFQGKAENETAKEVVSDKATKEKLELLAGSSINTIITERIRCRWRKESTAGCWKAWMILIHSIIMHRSTRI